MEIESDNGKKLHLKPNTPTVLGRGLGFDSNDGTVSRRHITLELHSNGHEGETRVSFEVVGKNPVWVRGGASGEIRVYRKGEQGELESGDAFSVSGKKHVWFELRSEVGGRCEDESFDDISDVDFDDVDISEIDPVKEFGFIIMGHEFDSYSKRMIHDIKKWNWFLEEPKKGSDEEDSGGQRCRGRRRKRKKGKKDDQGEDDEWEGESEEDKEVISTTKKVPRSTYSTRSKDHSKSTKTRAKGNAKSKTQESSAASEEEMDDGDDGEHDETLGGFIVDNEEDEEGEEEEEEFEDDEEDEDVE